MRAFVLAGAAFCTAASQAAVPNLLWEKFFGGDPLPGFFRPERLSAVDSGGNLFVAGSDFRQRDSRCMFVAKLAAEGSQQWSKTLCDETASNAAAYAVTVDPFDNVIVTGLTGAYTSEGAARTVKLSNDGIVIWDAKRTFGPTSIGGVDVTSDRSGNIYVLARDVAPIQVILRYSRDGALSWTSEPAPLRRAFMAVHPDGDVFVGGTRVSGDDLIWSVARLRAGDGSVRWRSDEAGQGSFLNAIAVDSRGNPIATGARNYPSKQIMKTAKYSEADGSRLWLRELETGQDTQASSIAVDSKDDVVVTGSNGHYKTLKYRSADGAPLWEASYAGRAGQDRSNGVSIDAAGDVTVTGYINLENLAVAEHTDIRTIKYSGRDGSQIWSAGYDSASGLSADSGVALHDVASGVYAVGMTSDLGLRVAKYGRQVMPVDSLQGLWWNSPPGSESGWGMNIAHQGDKLFLTWFTYDSLGRPTWYVMPNVQNVQGTRYEGAAYRMDGPAYSSVPFNSSLVAPVAESRVWLAFTDATHGRFSFLDGDTILSKIITRLDFYSPAPDCRLGGEAAGSANFQDLWWASPPGSESGWGLNLAHQGDVIFATWFTYNAERRATWFVGSEVRRQADGTFSGSLERTTGPPYNANPWDPSGVHRTPVGSMTLAFSDSDIGTYTYTVNGLTQSKAITRLSFATPATRCH